MNKKLNGALGLVLLVAVIGAVELILSSLPFRADLTAEKLYTLSKGSKAVLGKLEEDVTLKFYFSSSSADMPMGLKTYAGQFAEMANLVAGGRIRRMEVEAAAEEDAARLVSYMMAG